MQENLRPNQCGFPAKYIVFAMKCAENAGVDLGCLLLDFAAVAKHHSAVSALPTLGAGVTSQCGDGQYRTAFRYILQQMVGNETQPHGMERLLAGLTRSNGCRGRQDPEPGDEHQDHDGAAGLEGEASPQRPYRRGMNTARQYPFEGRRESKPVRSRQREHCTKQNQLGEEKIAISTCEQGVEMGRSHQHPAVDES